MSNTEHNPYAPPVAVIEDERLPGDDGNFIPGGQRVPVGNGLAWLGTGWTFFRQSALAWVALTLVAGVIWFVLAMIPLLNLLNSLLFPILSGGVMIACENQRQTGSLAIGDLFAGFRDKLGHLALLGLIAFGLSLISMIPIAIIFGMSFAGAFFGAQLGSQAISSFPITGLLLGGAIVFVAGFVIASLTWFAPALVCLQNLTPIDAMKNSFSACWRNVLPGLLYGIAAFVLIIIGSIPLGLGLLIVLPMFGISIYAAYRDIFIEK